MSIEESVQKEYFKLLNDSCFEYPDSILRSIFVSVLTTLMNSFLTRKEICEFRVICDETNNAPEDIESKYINVYVFYKEYHFDFEYKQIVIGNPRLLKI